MKKIFYSWQLDQSPKTGRNFIQRALEDAIKVLNRETEIDEAERDEVKLDHDTLDVSGSPPIVDTIFRKIDAAAVFVADLTFIAERVGGRKMPNPNVSIEYGYALRSVTHSRIIGVMNAAHGAPSRESLPFDLGHMRFPIAYCCPNDADEATVKRERSELSRRLKDALKSILDRDDRDDIEAERVRYVPVTVLGDHGELVPPRWILGELHDGSSLPQPRVSVGLAKGPAMWLRVKPKFAVERELLVTSLRSALVNEGSLVRPLNASGALNPRGIRGADGYGLASVRADGNAARLVYAFTAGEVWSRDAFTTSLSPGQVFFDPSAFITALADFAGLLARVNVLGPYEWLAGIHGILNRQLVVAGRAAAFVPPVFLKDSIKSSGSYSGDPNDAAEAIEPFIAAVFDAAHLTRI
ncbi:hypothetical protein [Burkholderia gladioli]|uniref:hypothetical protein n=1 Tax=Burkholderia gladioli TaxID=28095 RepID=UPI001640E6E1|nr:hypothetical protein [Burkholderia gladioli]